jgi:hypothetical protein
MNAALIILVAISAATILSLTLGVIGARYIRDFVIKPVNGPFIAMRSHGGEQIAAITGFLAVLVVLLLAHLTIATSTNSAAVTSIIDYFGCKSLIETLRRGL